MKRSTLSLSRLLPSPRFSLPSPLLPARRTPPRTARGRSSASTTTPAGAPSRARRSPATAAGSRASMRLTNLPTNDSKPELHLRNLDTGTEVVIAHASNPDVLERLAVDRLPDRLDAGTGRRSRRSRRRRGGFGGERRGCAAECSRAGIGRQRRGGAQGGAPQGAGGRGGAPATPQPLRRYELRELASGKTQAWKDIASATFNVDATHLILRRRAARDTAAGGRARRWRAWWARWRRRPGWRRAVAMPVRARPRRAAPTYCSSISLPDARRRSAASATSPSIARATCSRGPSTARWTTPTGSS